MYGHSTDIVDGEGGLHNMLVAQFGFSVGHDGEVESGKDEDLVVLFYTDGNCVG